MHLLFYFTYGKSKLFTAPKNFPHNGGYTLQPDHCHSVSPEKLFVMVYESDKRVIQQKVDDADIKDAVVIIPTLANVMAYDNLWE